MKEEDEEFLYSYIDDIKTMVRGLIIFKSPEKEIRSMVKETVGDAFKKYNKIKKLK